MIHKLNISLNIQNGESRSNNGEHTSQEVINILLDYIMDIKICMSIEDQENDEKQLAVDQAREYATAEELYIIDHGQPNQPIIKC